MKRTVEVIDGHKGGWVSFDAVLQAACKDVAEHTKANRVSIWRFEENASRIVCDCFYEAEGTSFSSGQMLTEQDCPKYFQTILGEQVIIAPDARNHPVTDELTESYFKPFDIYSLLDFILHENFKPIGVICCENAGAQRDWSEDNISYLRQIATLISFSFKRDVA
ncbi:MAG: GAF domain-containing protein [Rhodospirillales bacterium]|nr:GAF domain-containing protein [Alphaproteobacteria bacterium]MBL6947800.1 GAF domain-containing protein [Rhodospirillales bacterium]